MARRHSPLVAVPAMRFAAKPPALLGQCARVPGLLGRRVPIEPDVAQATAGEDVMSRRGERASARAHDEAQSRIPTQIVLALELLAQRGDYGVTGWELAREFPDRFTYPSASAVLSKLCAAGLVKDTDRQRMASTGYATVRVLSEEANDTRVLRGRAKGKDNEARIKRLTAELAHLRAHIVAMDGERLDCWSCGAENEIAIAAEVLRGNQT